ncbi:hypothetical protein M2132_000499 [Dysgonomonas sp. PH5-45]|uniref:hypothetical protein n=1 Tax=unclassified Dysgonomonas TaxID=2630389 RepID=UPI002473406E|nr:MULTISPECIES: hypothetical protein [unclassified Dysgonomonas]MDH6354177.1 hypothetical protein [Dysgonomonas sp. PH5-45]MDH6386972.1 hypothetical protein [Dysgonomonas sp. PH5-37]
MKKLLYLFLICLLFPATAFSTNYYWVGGAGNWSDINHWRTSSGGDTKPGVVPSKEDDVFFDANSGFTESSKTIKVDVTANCRNITFAGSAVPPEIQGVTIYSGTLNIYGSSVWQAGMTYNVSETYYKDAGTAKTIKSNGVAFKGGVYSEETTSISLQDNIECGGLFINAGTFNTNNFQLKTSVFYANAGTAPRTLNFGSSDIYITGAYFYTNNAACTVNAGTSHIHLTSGAEVKGYNGQTFYNVTFEGETWKVQLQTGNLNYNRLEFKGEAYIAGSNTIKQLVLAPGKLCMLRSGYTQTITGSLTAGQACAGWTTIKSVKSSGGEDYGTSTISMASGTGVNIEGVVIKGITATGGADFTVNNSIDDGGNTGWTFTAGSTPILYWVGGAGNWNDPAHWSLTPGGAGGACVPGPKNNVIFNASSGFTTGSETINIDETVYCKDITFSGTGVPPTLSSGNYKYLHIYGSSVWQAGMTVNVYQINYRDTGTPKTITSNGVTTKSIVNIYETSSVSLKDNFIGSEINVYTGTFDTKNFDMTLSYQFNCAIGESTDARTIKLGSSNIYVSYFDTEHSLATVDAGTSHIHFTVKKTSGSGFDAYPGQTFYNLSVENTETTNIGFSTVYPFPSTDLPVNFNRVDLKGGASFEGNFKFNHLTMAPGKDYTLRAGNTITVVNSLTVGQACAGWATLKSSTAGSQAIISMPSGATVNVQGVIMSDIQATDGATFIASSSVNNGGNTGWTFTGGGTQNLYWIGGAGSWNDPAHWSLTPGGTGGACVPGPGDDVFFNAGSGFTSASRTVTVEGSAFCRNVTVSGCTTTPIIRSTTGVKDTHNLNIYGSSTWQSGMDPVSVFIINYMDTGTPKTITSNGVTTGAPNTLGEVNFYETSNISLTDNFKVGCDLYHHAGTFNTNDFRIDIEEDYKANPKAAIVLNLGASDIYISGYTFNVSTSMVTLNAGTSHIHFMTSFSNIYLYGLRTYPGQTFYNVTFENANSTVAHIYNTASGAEKVTFNRVEFKGGGYIQGNNTFKELVLLGNKPYSLESGRTQTVTKNLTMSGTPCDVSHIQSITAGTQANLDVQAGTTRFDFVNIKDINASGKTLHFGNKSTVAGQNNTNITYDPYKPGTIDGLGDPLPCQVFDNGDPDSYTLTAAGFYGNEYTQYTWKKVGSETVIGTNSTLDMRPHGYGTYSVEVVYTNGVKETCRVSDTILINSCVKKVYINPNLRFRTN